MSFHCRMPLVFLCCAVVGCTSMGNEIPNAHDTPVYIEPADQEPSAIISGSMTTFLFQDNRARVESIDAMRVIESGPRSAPTVRVRPGTRSLVVIRDTEHGSGQAWAKMSFQAITGHNYVLHCEEKNILVNLGTKFWIEDESSGGTHVSEADGWGASHGPTREQGF